jgi:hypothetical protein
MRAFPFVLALFALPFAAKAGNLAANTTWDQAKVILYELPDADGRAEAIRYVESARDRFKKGAEVLDAAAIDASLPNKLKAGFVLYTTLGHKSKLLDAATGKLGWEFSGDTFRWRNVTAPAANLRLIAVGKNPYSKGFCLVYAAGSNRALAGINDVEYGPSSYYVFERDQLLKAGDYEEDLILRERLSRTAALEDMNQLFATLKRAHPDLLRHVTEEDYRKLKEQTAAGITAKLDAKGEIAIEDLASLFSYFAASFKDGHTSVVWRTSLNHWNTREKRFPAFRLRFANGRFFATAARDRGIAGAEVLAINGTPALEFLRPILDRCSGETLGFRAQRFLVNEPFWYYLTNLFSTAGPFTIRVRQPSGQVHDAMLETLDYGEYEDFLVQSQDAPFLSRQRGIRVEFFDSGSTAHFVYSSFAESAAEKKSIDHVFEEIRTKGARNLLLDIRGNWGGESGMAEYLFKYFYAGKFRPLRSVRARISLDLLSQFPWFAKPTLVLLSGHTISVSIRERSYAKPKAFFPGRTYLLIDNGSFSMATTFADMFREFHAGTSLGYETGGTPHMFGGPHPFVLKNSRINCNVAWTENFPPVPHAGDNEHGLIPDVPIDELKLADFRNEPDPVLSYSLNYIKSSR